MHKKKIERDPALREMMNYVKKDLNRAVSLQEFTKWCQSNPSILTPLRILQIHLRFQIIGPNFWTKMTEQRRAHPEMGAMDYLPKLQKRVIAETKFFINQGLIDKDERRRMSRRGRGPNGDHRDNVTRKQSYLVNYFHLSRYSITRGMPNKVVPSTPHVVGTAPPGSATVGVGAAAAPSATVATSEKSPVTSGVGGTGVGGTAGKDNNPSPTTPPKDSRTAAAPRRRRSSLLFAQKPNLLIKSEMPIPIKQKKGTTKKKKQDVYKEAIAAA